MAFEKKLSNLLDKKQEVKNTFVTEALKQSNVTTSGNGALKYATSGDEFVDNFSAISYFKEPRTYAEVSKDMELLWSSSKELCLKLAVYIRLVTRKSKIVSEDGVEILEVQKGQGLKNEGIMRMLWLAINQPKTFKANFCYFIAAGSWKDVFQMLSLDLQYHGWDNKKLDWGFFFLVISAGLTNPDTTHLVRKYLPTIKTNKNCKTIETQADTLVGRWIARKLFPELTKESAYKAYRLTKSEGIAHEWQQLISKQLYDAINFDHIAGRALSLLVGSRFLENHGLISKYTRWIENKSTVKYTGYVHELFGQLGSFRPHHIESHKEATINAQFKKLIETAKGSEDTNCSLLVVCDTSASMGSSARGCSASSLAVARSLALYFSEFLEGEFAGAYAEFEGVCSLRKWIGETPVDKYINGFTESYGSTDFQSVIDLFIRTKSNVPESDFPKGILCISDGEFDRTHTNTDTNFKLALKRLREAGFSDEYVNNFKIILWDVPNSWYGRDNSVKFEDFADAPNFFYLSGYDPSVISFILGNKPFKASPKNARELFDAAMDQDLLNRLKVIMPKKKKK